MFFSWAFTKILYQNYFILIHNMSVRYFCFRANIMKYVVLLVMSNSGDYTTVSRIIFWEIYEHYFYFTGTLVSDLLLCDYFPLIFVDILAKRSIFTHCTWPYSQHHLALLSYEQLLWNQINGICDSRKINKIRVLLQIHWKN